jgi:hypothetical protein
MLIVLQKGAYLPGVATDVQFLSKVLAIVSDRGMTVLDPFKYVQFHSSHYLSKYSDFALQYPECFDRSRLFERQLK